MISDIASDGLIERSRQRPVGKSADEPPELCEFFFIYATRHPHNHNKQSTVLHLISRFWIILKTAIGNVARRTRALKMREKIAKYSAAVAHRYGEERFCDFVAQIR
jgi:hypothetical protein